MPPIRSARILRSSSLPASLDPRARKAGLRGTNIEIRSSHQRHFVGVLTALAGQCPRGHPYNYRGHRLTRPRMNSGSVRPEDAGQYYQLCPPEKHVDCDQHYFPLSPPLSPDILALPELKEFFSIREELTPTPRTPKPQPAPPIPTHTTSTTAILTSTATVSVSQVPLDLTCPIRILLWTNADAGPTIIPGVYAGEDMRFRLDVYKTLFRKNGLRGDASIEMYIKAASVWKTWDRKVSISVFQSDEVVVLRVAGLSALKEWDEFEPFIY
ncbi:hypothetical protein B0H13DRAFT_1880364 [Mycena leptocephala]|nr:hypothetical protein B0H13DRAFT_1880364 [Mycena leptocephala]